MQKIIAMSLFYLALTSCGAQQRNLPCEPWGCKSVEYDPNPLCRFEERLTNQERLEAMLSDDPWGLYEDGYEVSVPYRLPLENEPKVLPPESYIRPQCDLTDEEAKRLSCLEKQDCPQQIQKEQTHYHQANRQQIQ